MNPLTTPQTSIVTGYSSQPIYPSFVSSTPSSRHINGIQGTAHLSSTPGDSLLDPATSIQNQKLEQATPICSIDTDLDSSFSESVFSTFTPKGCLQNHINIKESKMSTDNDSSKQNNQQQNVKESSQSQTQTQSQNLSMSQPQSNLSSMSSIASPPPIPKSPDAADPNLNSSSVNVSETPNKSNTLKNSGNIETPLTNGFCNNDESLQSLKNNMSESNENENSKIDLDLELDLSDIISQSTPQSSPAKKRPKLTHLTPTADSGRILSSITPSPSLFGSAKRLRIGPGHSGAAILANSPLDRTPQRTFFSPRSNRIGLITSNSPLTNRNSPFSRENTNTITNKEEDDTNMTSTLSNGSCASTISNDNDLSVTEAPISPFVEQSSKQNSPLVVSGSASTIRTNTGNEEEVDDDTPMDTSYAATPLASKRVRNHKNKGVVRRGNGMSRPSEDRKPKGIIKLEPYDHFDTRNNGPKRKKVRFDSELLASRKYQDNEDDGEPAKDNLDEEENNALIETKLSLLEEFDRDFSDSDDDPETSEIDSRREDLVVDPDPTLIFNSEMLLAQDNAHATTILDDELVDSIDEDDDEEFIFPHDNQVLDREDSEHDSEEPDHIDLYDPDYEDEQYEAEYDEVIEDDDDDNGGDDYPESDIAHIHKLLNKSIRASALPELQSHSQIRAAIHLNNFKAVIVKVAEEVQIQKDIEEERAFNSSNGGSLFGSSRITPRRNMTEKIIESYSKPIADDFYKWVAKKQRENKWDAVVDSFHDKLIEKETKKREGKDKEETPGPRELFESEDGKEKADELSADPIDANRAISTEDSEMLSEEEPKKASSDSQNNEEKQLSDLDKESASQSKLNTSNKPTCSEDKSENSPTRSDSKEDEEKPDELLPINPFTIQIASEILQEDLGCILKHDLDSVPWLTKTSRPFIKSLFNFESNAGLSQDFRSLQNQIRLSEEQDEDDTQMYNHFTQQQIPPFARSKYHAQYNFSNLTSHFSVYNNPTLPPTSSARPFDIAEYFTPSTVVPPTDTFSNLITHPQLRASSHIIGRKRLRSADNLYYSNHQGVNNGVSNMLMSGSGMMGEELSQEFREAEYIDNLQGHSIPIPSTTGQSQSSGLRSLFDNTLSTSMLNSHPLEFHSEMDDQNLQHGEDLPNGIKRRCLRPSASLNRTMIGTSSDISNTDFNPQLFGEPIATSSLIEPEPSSNVANLSNSQPQIDSIVDSTNLTLGSKAAESSNLAEGGPQGLNTQESGNLEKETTPSIPSISPVVQAEEKTKETL